MDNALQFPRLTEAMPGIPVEMVRIGMRLFQRDTSVYPDPQTFTTMLLVEYLADQADIYLPDATPAQKAMLATTAHVLAGHPVSF